MLCLQLISAELQKASVNVVLNNPSTHLIFTVLLKDLLPGFHLLCNNLISW